MSPVLPLVRPNNPPSAQETSARCKEMEADKKGGLYLKKGTKLKPKNKQIKYLLEIKYILTKIKYLFKYSKNYSASCKANISN